MDTSRNDLLGEIAADAALERSDFLVQSTEQFRRFLDANKARIDALGGLTLIDEDPDYLSIAPDLTFRSRTRYLDDLTGEWTSETEVIETAAELIELYNPADLYTAFAEAAREAAGLGQEPTAAPDLLESAGIGVDESMPPSGARTRTPPPPTTGPPPSPRRSTPTTTSSRRSVCTTSRSSSRSAASGASRACSSSSRRPSSLLTARIGDLIINDDDDERLTLTASGEFRAEVLTEEENEWRPLDDGRRARRVLRPDRRLR